MNIGSNINEELPDDTRHTSIINKDNMADNRSLVAPNEPIEMINHKNKTPQGVHYLYILFGLIVTDASILFQLPQFPILRPIIAFLFFSFIPGLLIIIILRYNSGKALQNLCVSLGLSLSFILLFGLVVNQVSIVLDYFKPLSTISIVSWFTGAIIVLCFFAYKRNSRFCFQDYFPLRMERKKALLPIVTPLLFPMLAVAGTCLMNMAFSNLILMMMLILIPIYFFIVILMRHRIAEITYPIAVFSIALAILLMKGLTSNYPLGEDVNSELYAFRTVANNLLWSMSAQNTSNLLLLTATLSTSLLPTIYWSLMGVNQLLIFKLVFQILFAITPVVCYLILKKYLPPFYAFISALFFASQVSFIFDLQSAMRTEIAILLFSILLIVLLDKQVGGFKKQVLTIVLIFSIVVSHYSVAYLLLFLLLGYWALTPLFKKILRADVGPILNATMLLLTFVFIFYWYNQTSAFHDWLGFIWESTISLSNFFGEGVRAQASYLPGNSTTLSSWIGIIILWMTFLFIAMGFIDNAYQQRKGKATIDNRIIVLGLIFGAVLVAFLVLPNLSKGYGNTRVYQQLLVVLSIGFVLGGFTIARLIKRPRYAPMILAVLLVCQFICATGLAHQVMGDPFSEALNRDGERYDALYIHDQEVVGAHWIMDNTEDRITLYTDAYGISRIMMAFPQPYKVTVQIPFGNDTFGSGGYIYLRYQNVVQGEIIRSEINNDIVPLSDYNYILEERNRIYSNGGSVILAPP